MNKLQFISEYFNFCTEHNLQCKDVLVSAGGALLMLGLRTETEDLDLDVSDRAYDRFLRLVGKDKERTSSHGTYLDVSELVSVHRRRPDQPVQEKNFVWLYSTEALIEQKTKLANAVDRPPEKAVKDLRDVKALKALL